MSKVLGIVAEYNPFHNGHLYHLEKSKKDTGSSYTVAIMSGNFTQRGNTSLIDKWSKAQTAISNGVDLVIELPVLYATSSAENFAEGAVRILDSLGIIDYLSFGAETSELEILDQCADVLYHEPKKYKTLLSHELSKGISFPKARENALMMYLNDIRKFANVLSSPNNILGIEYLKALKKTNSIIEPYCIPRNEVGYHDLDYTENMASSTAIRNMIKNDGFSALSGLMPASSHSILIQNMKAGHIVPDIHIFEKQILYLLRKMSPAEIAKLPDVTEGLEFAIKNAVDSCNTLSEFFTIIKSKRYTSTRLQRILLYALLGITKKDIAMSKKIPPYIRVLGLNKRGKFLISEIAKENPKLQIVTSVKRFTDDNSNKNLQIMLEKDIWATNVYTLGYEEDSLSNLDFTKKIVTKG
ncbi:MAG: nucleotidyltransferase [Clostridia bacterium]|nr:nucleotidyltransferase [Clostridia bacterium]